MTCAVGIDEDHPGWSFRCDLAECSANSWGDNRLHTRLIREAPRRATATPRDQVMAHPILRIARLKHQDGSVEQETLPVPLVTNGRRLPPFTSMTSISPPGERRREFVRVHPDESR